MKLHRNVFLAAVALCAAQAIAASTHTVTFRRMDGTVLMQTNVVHGTNASSLAPAGPNESADGLAFSRWDFAEKLASVTNDVTCWALYEATTAKPASTSIASQPIADRETPYSLDEYFQMYNNLAWSDEFSGTALDAGKLTKRWGQEEFPTNTWVYETSKWGELETYTEGPNQEVSNGTLKLICKRESDTKVTSTKIRSKSKVHFKLGRCEIRAKVTKELGAFPAFWLMGTGGGDEWPWCGELDIMEQVSGKGWIKGTLHIAQKPKSTGDKSYFSNGAYAASEDGVHWGDGFHRFGIIITERELVWYVDDYIFQRQDIRDSRYDIFRNYGWYILLNYAFGSGWTGVTDLQDPRIANFQREDFEIDYCRIFTNTTEGNTVTRVAEPEGVLLTRPVKATIWRGWERNYGMFGAEYFSTHLNGDVASQIKTAMREYFGRDNCDIALFHPRMDETDGGRDAPIDVPGYTSLGLSPLSGMTTVNTNANVKMRSTIIFNSERFSRSNSSVGSIPLSDDPNYTNCCAVVAELVERDTGAKVKVVSAFVSTINGATTGGSVAKQGFDTLISKLGAMKDEKVILLLQGWSENCWIYLDNRVGSELNSSFSKIGQYSAIALKNAPVCQSAWATANYLASAENPAPLSVPKANGQPTGVYTNQAYCATVQFDAEPEVVIEYGQLDKSAFAKKMGVTFSGYSGTTLTDFPVLVKLSTAIDGFSYGDFQMADGGDLRFADSTGKLLPHEIDTWNTNGVSTVWVKVPSLAANGKITACYGCANPPEVAAKDVWDDDYVGVWHLGESALPLKESSETSSDFSTSAGTGIGYAATGIVGGSVDFGESGNSRSVVAPDHNALDGFTACTFEVWTLIDAEARKYKKGDDVSKGLLTKRTGYQNQASYHLWDSGGWTSVCISSNSTSHTQITGIENVPAGEWVHQVVTFNAGSVANYRSGVANRSGTTDVTKINAGSANLHLGNFQAGDTRNFPGKVDELRISKVARSAAWVKATHDTIADASFATYAMENAPSPAYTFTHEVGVTFSDYSGGSALTDFPVLVRLSANIPGFSYDDFQLANGGDLRFFDAAGNLLSHEIDTWNQNGVSTVWVKVPTLNAATAITAKYGCANPPANDPKAVWSNGYVGVWHLGEGGLPLKESSETSSDFTQSSGKTIVYGADGIVGGSVDFCNGPSNAVVALDHDALDAFEKFTVETWTYQDEPKHNAGILSKRKSSSSEMAYYFMQTINGGTTYGPICVGTNRNAGTDWTYHHAPTMGRWNHMVFSADMTISSLNLNGYKNGVHNSWVVSKNFLGPMPNCASDLILGNLNKNAKDYSFNGRIDEVRISNVIRSADWIKATYDTVMDPGFATYSTASGMLAGYGAWANAKELEGGFDAADGKGLANGVRYAFDIDPEKGPADIGTPIMQVVCDANGNPSVQSRDFATGRDDVTFGILATENLTNWQNASLIPMEKFNDGYWKPSESSDSAYVYPAKMFFKYTIEVK